ncbi:mechanosensitive ion channel domain-containing protein, partial [Rhizobium ruizarguesonis]
FDDAFRIGEYIQAAKYKVTVEGFSLRSIRLRHHRVPVTIVPFGELGAVQNLSRDLVIDIITLTLNYDSDLEEDLALEKPRRVLGRKHRDQATTR